MPVMDNVELVNKVEAEIVQTVQQEQNLENDLSRVIGKPSPVEQSRTAELCASKGRMTTNNTIPKSSIHHQSENILETITPLPVENEFQVNKNKAGCGVSFTSMGRKSSESSLPRRVSFPKSDDELVTGYLEPANPWEQALMVKRISDIIDLYVLSCHKHNTKPIQYILDHLKSIDLNKQERQSILSLKSISLMPSDCEALEEVLKRLQYKSIDLSSCGLNESGIMAMFDMIEYYEATTDLDISSNPKGMTYRGWNSCSNMISRSQELRVLTARGNPISKANAECLGSALTSSNLHTLKLEHCGLKGQPLNGLCFKLRKNRVLKELWLAHNDLDCHDASALGELLKVNHYIELIDISNNNIRDDGLRNIANALILQSKEFERRLLLQRATAIDSDSFSSSVDYINDVDTKGTTDTNLSVFDENKYQGPQSAIYHTIEIESVTNNYNDSLTQLPAKTDEQCQSIITEYSTEAFNMQESNSDKNSTKIAIPKNGGKSMLDKLLSMDSESDSEKSLSQLSTETEMETETEAETDTLTACYSNDTSLIVDEIFNPVPNSQDLNMNRKNEQTTVAAVQKSRVDKDLIETKQLELFDGNTLKVDESGNNLVTTFNKNCTHPTDLISNIDSSLSTVKVFEVHAEESDCVFSQVSHVESDRQKNSHAPPETTPRLHDLNIKNTRLCDDYEDTHSTDSAFESASEGDISRHLPEECQNNDSDCGENLLLSLKTTSYEIITKNSDIESATIACESTENLVKAIEMESTSNSYGKPDKNSELLSKVTTPLTAKVTIVEDESQITKHKDMLSPSPTPPPPSTSPGGASVSLRRTDSACSFITQSTRNRSQSSDSLCSDNSLEGSVSSDSNYSVSTQLNEKLTKNDTLTRQQRQNPDNCTEHTMKSPSGLKALAVWNNNLSKDTGLIISDLLNGTSSLELLNIGKNCLSNEFIAKIKDNLIRNTTLTTLGLQSAHLSAKGIETLASILSFGGNSTLQRIDIRDNKLEVESLTILAEALKSNTTVMQIDIDDEPKRLSVGSDAHLDYTRVLENVRSMCSRNEKSQLQLQTEKNSNVPSFKRKSGYYVGSRKISLTCHTRPLIDMTAATSLTPVSVTQSPNKLEVKRKSGARLRSPVPSPPTMSPSSSPNRSRFQVFRVNEVSPLTSPQVQAAPEQLPKSPLYISDASILGTTAISSNTGSSGSASKPLTVAPATPAAKTVIVTATTTAVTTMPLSSSFPSMATVTSSTQSIKRTKLPRTRFHVSKIYEDYPMMPSFRSPSEPALSNDSPITTPTITQTIEPSRNSENHSSNLHESSVQTINKENENENITLSTLLYTAPLQSSLSSSSSTSPVSTISNSSSTSSSSSSAPITLDNTDGDSGCKTPELEMIDSSLKQNIDISNARCPIAVFSDNDITLTKNNASNVFPNKLTNFLTSDETITPSSLQRPSKRTWFSNSEPIMQLRTLFQSPVNNTPPQSSTSNASNSTDTRSTLSNEEAADDIPNDGDNNSQSNLSLAQKQPTSSSWFKLGSDILNITRNDSASSLNTTAALSTMVPARSLIDAASKQIRDFGKQMFQQNLSFGNSDTQSECTAETKDNVLNTEAETVTLKSADCDDSAQADKVDEMIEEVQNLGKLAAGPDQIQ